MKVVISLTTTPPRMGKIIHSLPQFVNQVCHEVWINIPKSYSKWPDWDGDIPPELKCLGTKFVLNTECEDWGPATKFVAPALKLLPDDLIIYVDDDTKYPDNLATNFLKWHQFDSRCAWGLSGFTFENYFKGQFPRQHGVPVDVLEGYGAVIVKAKWVQDALPDLKELLEITWHDDISLCNVFNKTGILRKTICTPECNIGQIQQYNYGFEQDALHHLAGEGGHMVNNSKILKNFEDKGKNYFSYKCS